MTFYLKKITVSGILLAFCLLLPFATGYIPHIGNMLSPMHIPVLICGMVCGWSYGLGIGLLAPIIRYFLFGMPPLMPIGLAMTFELAAYGAISGFLYRVMFKNKLNLYIALIVSMVIGRFVWGLAMFMITGLNQVPFTWQMFINGAFITAIPAIILQIVLIPPIVIALNKAALNFNE